MTPLDVQDLVRRALAEDLASGDLTTDAIVPPTLRARGEATAKSALVVCGGELFRSAFHALDREAQVELTVADGTAVEAGAVLWRVSGTARALLQAERAALNLVQRASGIATLTREFVRALPEGSTTRITDTRKTTPGLRALERYAVRTGGGHNHRDNLGAAVLIKDNHIAIGGGVRTALERAKAYAPHTSKIEIEVTELAMLEEALHAGADVIMLDNFAPHEISIAVARTRGRALIEVSGGIRRERIAELARAGVDVISVGALTHSAPASDISLNLWTADDGAR